MGADTVVTRLAAIDEQFQGRKLPPAERAEWDRLMARLAIPAQDLRAVEIHGRCRCGTRAAADDVHFVSCPHQRYSKSSCVLVAR